MFILQYYSNLQELSVYNVKVFLYLLCLKWSMLHIYICTGKIRILLYYVLMNMYILYC